MWDMFAQDIPVVPAMSVTMALTPGQGIQQTGFAGVGDRR